MTDWYKRVDDAYLDVRKRTFDTGATRDADADKLDFEGFMSPLVVLRFGEYMHENRRMADGSVRASDNWQKGIPRDSYMKSLMRHAHTLWLHHRGYSELTGEDVERALCGVLFNAQGYLHEVLEQNVGYAVLGQPRPTTSDDT